MICSSLNIYSGSSDGYTVTHPHSNDTLEAMAASHYFTQFIHG